MSFNTDHAYAAGLFDGEGTVRIKDNGGMALELEMADIDSVENMRAIFGGSVRKQNRLTKTGRVVHRWAIYGPKAIASANDMMPFSKGKRRQLEVLLAYDQRDDKADIRPVARKQLKGLKAPEPLAVSWDLETMGLDPNEKNILTCAMQYGTLEDRIHTICKWNSEEQFVLATRGVLEQIPWTMGYNSSRFDINYLNVRLKKYGHRTAFLGSHSDVSEMYKEFTGRKKRTSLVDMANELGLTDEKVYKTPIDWDKWHAANRGDKEGMDYVVEHGKMDVILTRRGHDVIIQKARENAAQ